MMAGLEGDGRLAVGVPRRDVVVVGQAMLG